MSYCIITRPTQDANNIQEDYKNLGYKIIMEPMFDIKHISLDHYNDSSDFIAITSHNSLHALKYLPNLPIYIVGEHTASLINSLNKTVSQNIDECLKNILSECKGKKGIYLRGKHITADIATICREHGIVINEKIVYDTEDRTEFSSKFLDFLSSNHKSIITFYSYRTASIFLQLVKKHNMTQYLAKIYACCISEELLPLVKEYPFLGSRASLELSHKSLVQLAEDISIEKLC